jgi:3-oxoacyl-[acyl-carrier-protein] synthase III
VKDSQAPVSSLQILTERSTSIFKKEARGTVILLLDGAGGPVLAQEQDKRTKHRKGTINNFKDLYNTFSPSISR